jgi:hypothetical protein
MKIMQNNQSDRKEISGVASLIDDGAYVAPDETTQFF